MAHLHRFRRPCVCLIWSLLPLFSATSATVICDGCPDPNRFDYPGVGFHLALDYGYDCTNLSFVNLRLTIYFKDVRCISS